MGKIDGNGGAHEAARGLEAFFLRQVLKEAKAGSTLDGGPGASTFHEMLDDSLAEQMSKAGGIGLAELVERELGGSAATTPPANHPIAARAATAYQLHANQLHVSSHFGTRTDPIDGTERPHDGIDLPAALGTEVLAPIGGTVVRAEAAGSYGNLVVVDHGEGRETRYAHLGEIEVRPGDRVEAGTRLGRVGITGRTTGPHLHFEVRQQGKAVDPETAFKGLKILR